MNIFTIHLISIHCILLVPCDLVEHCHHWYGMSQYHPYTVTWTIIYPLQWLHIERDVVSNHRCLDCLLKHLSWRRSNKTSKLRISGLCEGNSPVTSEFPSQRASNAENVSIWWFDDVIIYFHLDWETDIEIYNLLFNEINLKMLFAKCQSSVGSNV